MCFSKCSKCLYYSALKTTFLSLFSNLLTLELQARGEECTVRPELCTTILTGLPAILITLTASSCVACLKSRPLT